MKELHNPQTRRAVLRRSALTGAAVVGTSGITAAAQAGDARVAGLLRRSRENPISQKDIANLQARIKRRFRKQFGESLRLATNPVGTEEKELVAFAISVDRSGTASRYHGLVADRSVANDVAADTAQRHATAQQFVEDPEKAAARQPSSLSSAANPYLSSSGSRISAQIQDDENFSELSSNLMEFGDCDGGKVITDTQVFQHKEDSSIWGMATNSQVIPGVNTTCETTGLSSSGRAEHRWYSSAASDPLINDRAPTKTKDGSVSVSISVSASVGIDTSVSGTIGASYTQPDLYFASEGSSESTELNWSYNQSSWDITWDTEYLSMCEQGESLNFGDNVVEEYYDGSFYNGPDATASYTFTIE